MHVDINSCFATIEQQANPKLRGKPTVVAAYTSASGCILASSIEAKKLGIKTGMRVKEAKLIYGKIIVLPPDPDKYRAVHVRLKKLLAEYCLKLNPKSIDEFVMDFENMPSYHKGMVSVAKEIKKRIRAEIGEWISVSIGISTNRFLAKMAAGLIKPDGLEVIDSTKYLEVYNKISLMDLTGIKRRNTARLNSMGIFTVMGFYNSPQWKLKAIFHSAGYYWYLRLHGFEIDDVSFGRHSYGNSYALPKPYQKIEDLTPILQKLVEKTGARLRKAGYRAKGVHLGILYRDRTYWHKGMSLPDYVFDSRDVYKALFKLLLTSPRKPVRNLAESVFGLVRIKEHQLAFFEDVEVKSKLVQAIDAINDKWGSFTVTPARMLTAKRDVADRIAFGGVKELEEIIT